ncbi:MAG: RNA polymerase sigma factor [Cyanobacteriota bacterium]
MHSCKNNNTSNLEDLKVIAEVLSGNKHAYGTLITKYQNKLYNMALRISHNVEDSLDITQESFLKAYYNLNKFDSNKPFLPWLLKINHNTALTFIKKRKKSVDISKMENVITTKDNTERKVFVESLLNLLPEDYRILLELRHYQDMTYEDMARELNITVSNVKSKLFRARKQVQELFRRSI